MHPSALVLAFDRETITIAALWSMIVASVVFLVGVVVIYRRERRSGRIGKEAGSEPGAAVSDGETPASAAAVSIAADRPPPVAAEAPSAPESAPPQPEREGEGRSR
jgi:hypothetical protein